MMQPRCYDPDVLPMLREMRSKDPGVLDLPEEVLQALILDELGRMPQLIEVANAVDILISERGMGVYP